MSTPPETPQWRENEPDDDLDVFSFVSNDDEDGGDPADRTGSGRGEAGRDGSDAVDADGAAAGAARSRRALGVGGPRGRLRAGLAGAS
ncbi:hypothetical protein, partial [Micrococcus lacusdianchii]|uniref:hypothetical protein n=1 Tax=Micrococcus lacusdianchii TaxID=2915940 RepID=UPI0020058B4D